MEKVIHHLVKQSQVHKVGGERYHTPPPSTFLWRRKFNRCSLLVEIYSLLIIRCKIIHYSLQNSLIIPCRSFSLQNSLVTRCKSYSLQKITCYLLQKLLVAKNYSLLVAKFICYSLKKFTRYALQNSLVTKHLPSLVAKLLAATNHLLLNAKDHSSPIKTITSP